MASVLITGGAGFIGSHLVARCLKENHIVHVLVRPETSLHRLRQFRGNIQLHSLHLDDHEALQRCFAEAKPELVFHLATSTRRKEKPGLGDALASVNEDLLGLLSTLAVAAEARPVPKMFVRTGSLAAYGRAPTPHVESLREMPNTVYAAALVAGGHYVQGLQSRLPFPVVTARLSLTYGPAQSESFLIPSLIRHCLAGEPSTIRHPSARRDLIFVDDVVEALCRLPYADLRGGEVVNIASGNAPTMRETVTEILAATGADSANVEFRNVEDSEDVDLCPSPVLARELLDWNARVSLDEGLERTVAWYRTAITQEGIPRFFS
ncbi:NAD(P)-dependent oxidoreductase [Mesorhizobium sp. M00.F.Ca.ET.216.01.1.1]|uniref:NAD-dependent epimerase/dehydratase family protein n=1 Tax=Mesorhizobium sp. M00.F.Ca.ET.216.01.1.1 TaxID=2500528 RepID=UPI000FDC0248|nr:NAD(P)-dependent oxidoreductase [Mesorhizobium sp. M00.F.Ca.ET.216.01.1.1]TGQ34643.1 NAD(P)-dependent oxidoreductase [Mesorhizobium sp. M00.F.Ca.ET.216.01.1.1]